MFDDKKSPFLQASICGNASPFLGVSRWRVSAPLAIDGR